VRQTHSSAPHSSTVQTHFDSLQIRRLVRLYFDRKTDFRICGEAVDGLDAIEKASELNPGLLILDESMPRMDGLHAVRILHSANSDVPIILKYA